jgi:hypothetical protein
MGFGFYNLIYGIILHIVTRIRYYTFTIPVIYMTHKQL